MRRLKINHWIKEQSFHSGILWFFDAVQFSKQLETRTLISVPTSKSKQYTLLIMLQVILNLYEFLPIMRRQGV